jgi:putative FMN-dependent luciferase-like monooxygenase
MARTGSRRLGFFTRLLDQATAGERYRLATEQIVHAERHGFDSAWVAQHHFDGDEGGLPAPFVFLAHVAARTSRIRLGTGIVTLPLDEPVRVAEDATVFDLISNGRLELGLGSGGTPSAFAGFGRESADRVAIFDRHMTIVRGALAGKPLGGGNILYPAAPQLIDRIWQATFSAPGGERAGKAGDGLMLSRTQLRPRATPKPRSRTCNTPLSMPISGRCRTAANRASWRPARYTSLTTAKKRYAWPISASAGLSIISLRSGLSPRDNRFQSSLLRSTCMSERPTT